ncbi:FusB/FusC family EF-G-binding protein [Paenibacillus albicereus]|uniref:FusB/FusC family EF-G-binding protein n=1 Tax=Paenibacillus albicereus TaxID=2726185 RepID=A0A6H2GTG5_9BACL|nr:FusB/FusC family EF-G-binding protein [Paenibacillus albicereus]QJC50723.1 FusB/FusC family EF-G-binding protein [Paenibacillus albicereus]
MIPPFIRNHQFNGIQKQVRLLQQACASAADPKVLRSAREGVLLALHEAFPDADEGQRALLEPIAGWHAADDFRLGLHALQPYRLPFPTPSDAGLRRLFPKVKKLKTPDLAELDLAQTTYLGWTEAGSGRMLLVCGIDGMLIGVEGRVTGAVRGKNVCFACRHHGEVGLFTAVAKHRPAKASPDYYKAIGNYICLDSAVCNRQIEDAGPLERFVRDVTAR